MDSFDAFAQKEDKTKQNVKEKENKFQPLRGQLILGSDTATAKLQELGADKIKKIHPIVLDIITNQNPEDRANKHGAKFQNDKLDVYVYLNPEHVRNPPKSINILSMSENIIFSKLSFDEIQQLADSEAIQRIDLPVKAKFFDHDVSEGVVFSAADQMHAAGFTGQGVVIAVLDDGFFTNNTEISGNIQSTWFDPACPIQNITCTEQSTSTSSHGTAVAEIIVDMAPDVDLRLYAIDNSVGFNNAVDDAISNGADIITASVGFPTLGGNGTTGLYRDGTSSVAQKINNATNAGIFSTVAAGNQGTSHWMGNYTISPTLPSEIPDLNLLGSYESVMDFNQTATGAMRACLPVDDMADTYFATWNAWTTTNEDYDIWLYEPDMSSVIPQGFNVDQNSTASAPFESISVFPAHGEACLVLASFWSTEDHFFHINTEGNILDPLVQVRNGSIDTPADAAGALTIGAINHFADELEDFSSSGPTDDERLKPEICGPDRTLTHQTDLNPPSPGIFPGTSASTPHVAGSAALLLEKYPSLSPGELKNLLIEIARFNASYSVDNLCGSDSGAVDLSLVPGPAPLGTDVVVPVGSHNTGCENTFSCYNPFQFVINQGEQVIWYNDDTATHTVTSGTPANGPDGIFDSGLLQSGTSFSHIFQSSRTVDYFCMIHPWMTGEVVVNEVPCSPPGSGDWTITSSCTLSSSSVAPGNVIIQNGAVLTIPSGLSLDIDFINNFLRIEFPSGVFIKSGGSLN